MYIKQIRHFKQNEYGYNFLIDKQFVMQIINLWNNSLAITTVFSNNSCLNNKPSFLNLPSAIYEIKLRLTKTLA